MNCILAVTKISNGLLTHQVETFNHLNQPRNDLKAFFKP